VSTTWEPADHLLAKILKPKRRWKIETIRVWRSGFAFYRCRITDRHLSSQPLHIERDSIEKLAAAIHVRLYTTVTDDFMAMFTGRR
jgi:hypothetical protein